MFLPLGSASLGQENGAGEMGQPQAVSVVASRLLLARPMGLPGKLPERVLLTGHADHRTIWGIEELGCPVEGVTLVPKY